MKLANSADPCERRSNAASLRSLSCLLTFKLFIYRGIIQLYGHCIATLYALSRYLVNLNEIGTSCRRRYTVTQKPINTTGMNNSPVQYNRK